jgi:hypothetical protein
MVVHDSITRYANYYILKRPHIGIHQLESLGFKTLSINRLTVDLEWSEYFMSG